MMVPAKPPQPTADAESFATSQMLGLGLSGAVLPGNVLRSVCEKKRKEKFIMQRSYGSLLRQQPGAPERL